MYHVNYINAKGESIYAKSDKLVPIKDLKSNKGYREVDYINVEDESNRFVISMNKNDILSSNQELPITLFRLESEPILRFIHKNIEQIYYKTPKFNEIKLIDIYKKVCSLPDVENIFTSFGIGFRINTIIKEEFNFINTIKPFKLNPITARKYIKKLIDDTHKLHVFLDLNRNKVFEYLDFSKYIRNYGLHLSNDINRSMFQKFRSFVGTLELEKFFEAEDMVKSNENKYSKLFDYLLNIGTHFPIINLKAIKISPNRKSVKLQLLNCSKDVKRFDDPAMTSIFACIELAGQTNQFENNIERVKLLNC